MAQAKIIGIGSYLPERVLTNKDLEKMVETTDEWITTRTGIRERRIAAEDEHTSHMGVHAAQAALKDAGIDSSQIDLVLVSTSTPDHVFPSTASIIQHAIGAPAAAFDFQSACAGFVYGLSTAKSFVESGAFRNVLLIASEKLSTLVDYEDRATCILFGDGASAVVVSQEGEGLIINDVHLGADGVGGPLLVVPAGGAAKPPTHETIDAKEHYLRQDGREIYKHAVRRMVEVSQECLIKYGINSEQVDWLVPHQANERIIESVAKRLALPMEKVYLTISKYGNTSASSQPIALHELMKNKELKKGTKVMLTAFGAGFTWGATLLEQSA